VIFLARVMNNLWWLWRAPEGYKGLWLGSTLPSEWTFYVGEERPRSVLSSSRPNDSW